MIKAKRKKKREKCRAKRKRISEKSKENHNPKKIKFSDSGSESDSSADETEPDNNEREIFDKKYEEEILSSDHVGITGAHGASIDAFMAIYTLVSLLSTETPPKPMMKSLLPTRLEKLEPFRNRLNGPNPNTGFLVSKSSFVKLSDLENETVSSFLHNT